MSEHKLYNMACGYAEQSIKVAERIVFFGNRFFA